MRALRRGGGDHDDRASGCRGRRRRGSSPAVTPTDCSAGPSAPAPPNSSAAQKQRDRVPAREDDQRHRHQALAGRDALVPAAGVVERQVGAADAGEGAAGGRGEEAHAGRRAGPWRAAASALSPTTRTIRPTRVLRNAHHRKTASATPTRNSDVDLQRRLHLRDVGPAAERDRRAGRARPAGCRACRRRRRGRCRSSISAMPMAMSLTLGKLADRSRGTGRSTRPGQRRRPARRARASRSGRRPHRRSSRRRRACPRGRD